MIRFVVFSVIVSFIMVGCMAQTFQYSRGWTNGKRSSSHFHEDPTIAEIFEYPESERRLEKCMVQLQRLIHNPFLIRPSFAASNINANANSNNLFPSGNGISGSGSIRHQSNEIFEDLASSEPGEFSTKHN